MQAFLMTTQGQGSRAWRRPESKFDQFISDVDDAIERGCVLHVDNGVEKVGDFVSGVKSKLFSR